ncbi:MAG: GDSL-type esterase/lipase family protein [Ruminococcus sp.]|nr:GDSL-type esterase/lipase family protein [Ruminococcus sp.]
MEQDNNEKLARQRKKRVRAQQNFITALCLGCMLFTVGWSVYAVKEDKIAEAGTSNSSVAKSESSSKADSSETDKKNKDESSQSDSSAAEINSKGEYSRPADTEDDLSDAVFIGDSRTVGMMNSTDKPKATFLCAVGLNIDTALTSADITLENGNYGTIPDALAQKQYGRVYIAFGTNEMGWPYIDTFKEHYTELVSKIVELQPDAKIYCLGILPVTASKDAEGETVNNANAETFSQAISEVAAQLGVNYLDCSAAVEDENGYLPEEASTDGVHLNSEYCLRWQNFIIDNT